MRTNGRRLLAFLWTFALQVQDILYGWTTPAEVTAAKRKQCYSTFALAR
jgi:hypothetical protein